MYFISKLDFGKMSVDHSPTLTDTADQSLPVFLLVPEAIDMEAGTPELVSIDTFPMIVFLKFNLYSADGF